MHEEDELPFEKTAQNKLKKKKRIRILHPKRT